MSINNYKTIKYLTDTKIDMIDEYKDFVSAHALTYFVISSIYLLTIATVGYYIFALLDVGIDPVIGMVLGFTTFGLPVGVTTLWAIGTNQW